LELRPVSLSRQSHSLALQGAVVRLPVALLPRPLLHRSTLRISGWLWSSSGDASAAPQSIEQALKLLKAAPPWRRELEPVYAGLAAIKEPIDRPAPDSEIEDWVFAASALMFVEPTQSERARQVLRGTLGAKRVEYLLALLTFIRAAHYWTVVHPGLEIEDDVRELMSTQKELASLLLQDPDLGYH